MVKEVGLDDSFTQDIAALVASFSERDTAGKQSLSQLLMPVSRQTSEAYIYVLFIKLLLNRLEFNINVHAKTACCRQGMRFDTGEVI